MAAWVLYVLACASFSPDDSKIAFPSYDAATGTPSVAIYNRVLRTTRTLLAFPAPAPGETGLLGVRPVWTPDGTRVVALWAEDKVARIAVVPIAAGSATRLFAVPDLDDAESAAVYPPAIVGEQLFFASKGAILRVNLRTGAVVSAKAEGNIVLVGQGSTVYYEREVESQNSDSRIELGTVDPSTLALTLAFQTPPIGDAGLLAISRDGTQAATAVKNDHMSRILIFQNKQLQRTIPIDAKDGSVALGAIQWSPTWSTLYTTLVRSGADGQPHQFEVLEVAVKTGAQREIPLFSFTGKLDDGDALLFQLDVSHDGRMLAGASTYLLDRAGKASDGSQTRLGLAADAAALYMVDLSRPGRPVTKVPIPVPKAVFAAAQER